MGRTNRDTKAQLRGDLSALYNHMKCYGEVGIGLFCCASRGRGNGLKLKQGRFKSKVFPVGAVRL